MKKTLIWILGLALLAAASVLATITFLTYEETEENIMTIGKVRIDLLEYERINTETANGDAKVQKFTNEKKPLRPAVIKSGFDYTAGTTNVDWTQDTVKWEQADKNGYISPIWDPAKINNEVDKMVFLKNSGDYDAYVRLYFAFEAGNFNTLPRFQKMIHINLNDNEDEWAWEWIPQMATNEQGGKYFIARATYQKELKAGDFTEISLSQIALDYIAMNEDVRAFGKTYEVFVNAQGIQSAGFKDPDTALDEGFGTDIPFDMTLAQGVTLYNALHYLNGDDSNVANKITDKVAKVTFGFNKDHQDVVNNFANRVVLTSGEQDAEVYTYYVPNGSNYDVYVLADKKIYTPKDSTNLFREMTSLTKVDTINMDVSRTESMRNMFRKCPALTDLNVSNWKTSNVTDMYCMFYSCSVIDGLDVSKWNVSKVTNMSYMFCECNSISSLNIAGWDVGQVTDMSFMFYSCNSLTSLNLSGWDVSNVTTFDEFFSCSDSKLVSLNVSNWNLESAESMKLMFYGCKALTSLDLSSWKNVGNVKTMYAMFNSCAKLETLKIGTWDVSGVTVFENMFGKCNALKNIDVKNWNVSNAQNMAFMFRQCDALISLDLSGWETASLTQTTQMFEGDGLLTTIYVGDGWDMSKVTTSDSKDMFKDCAVLVGQNDTTIVGNPIDATYARVDTPENPGYLTYKPAESTTPEQSQ